MSMITAKQILASKANDNSPDWRQWSTLKCSKERGTIPELDRELDRLDAMMRGFRGFLAKMDRRMRRVDSDGNTDAVFAYLSQRYQIPLLVVYATPLPMLLEWIKAYEPRKGDGEAGDGEARVIEVRDGDVFIDGCNVGLTDRRKRTLLDLCTHPGENRGGIGYDKSSIHDLRSALKKLGHDWLGNKHVIANSRGQGWALRLPKCVKIINHEKSTQARH